MKAFASYDDDFSGGVELELGRKFGGKKSNIYTRDLGLNEVIMDKRRKPAGERGPAGSLPLQPLQLGTSA